MLTDLLGYYRRNAHKLNNRELRKTILEMKETLKLMENKLNKGVD